jgi:hypothetical protein
MYVPHFFRHTLTLYSKAGNDISTFELRIEGGGGRVFRNRPNSVLNGWRNGGGHGQRVAHTQEPIRYE